MSDKTGEAWRAFCQSLEKTGAVILDAQSEPLERAEGFRYLTRLLRVALEMNLEWADPDFPGFYQASHVTAKIGADNPDNHYLNATVTPARRYRIRGKRGTAPILTFASKANRYATDGTMASTGELALEDMKIAKDGSFEIIVSKDKPAGDVNWLPMQDDSSILIVRQTFLDRANETANELSIETIDGPPRPAPLSPEYLIAALQRSAGFVDGTARTFVRWAELFREQQLNQLETVDQAMFQRAGGDPDIFYLHGFWQLKPDEGLELVAKIPKCKIWNFQLNNYWMESLDYRTHTIHVNPHTAKLNEAGEVTIVIAARDPGYGNWVETAGHDHGTMLWRWTGAEQHPIPRARVIKLKA
ncbi:MAG: DUF1214 domain-containing protein [Hyphomonadaceae bacterium]|nr:DUF1214 domain-containing protein [Hyphomonadaceae bacterium]